MAVNREGLRSEFWYVIERSGLKQKYIAQQTGVTWARVSAIAVGRVRPSPVEAAALCKFFKMSANKLFPEHFAKS